MFSKFLKSAGFNEAEIIRLVATESALGINDKTAEYVISKLLMIYKQNEVMEIISNNPFVLSNPRVLKELFDIYNDEPINVYETAKAR